MQGVVSSVKAVSLKERSKKNIGAIFGSGKDQSFRDQATKAMFTRSDSGVSVGVVDSSPVANVRGGFHAVRLDRECPNLSIAEVSQLCPPDECLLDEIVQRLSVDSQWRRRRVILHREIVLFIDLDDQIVMDSIPLQNVSACVRCPDEDDDKIDARAFRITLHGDGTTPGPVIYCRSRSEVRATNWVSKITELAVKANRGPTCLERYQAHARRIERRVEFSMCAACLILANFAVICAESQLLPDPSSQTVFSAIDIGFTAAFTIELFIIMFGRLPHAFWRDKWNVFDFLIVTFSIVQLILTDIVEVKQLRLLRMFRVVRVLRVFGKLQQLRHIVDSITRSILPCTHAIFICLMVVFIYATIGVDTWREEAPLAFGNFFLAVWTLFSVVTFEDWPNVLLPFPENEPVRYDVVFYLYSYVGLVNYVLLQVLVAVLLESFFEDISHNVANEEKCETKAYRLDPLMEVLLTHFDTEDDLANRIAGFFRVFDADNSGLLSLHELQEGIRKLPLPRPCNMTMEDFEEMTRNIQLYDDEGERILDLVTFDALMRKELRTYAQRSLASCIRKTSDLQVQILLGTMKMLLVDNKATQNLLLTDGTSHSEPANLAGSFRLAGSPKLRSRSRSPARGHPPTISRCVFVCCLFIFT